MRRPPLNLSPLELVLRCLEQHSSLCSPLCYVSLLELNVQGLLNKFNNLEVLLEDLEPHIISLVEHWCDETALESVAVPGFELAASYCRPSRIHGGSMLLVRRGLQAVDLDLGRFSVEMHCELCALRLNIGASVVCVISVYRPPSGDVGIFLDILGHVLQVCSSLSPVIFVCGDFNINYLDESCNHRKMLYDLISSFNLKITCLQPTRISVDGRGNRSESKIDYILTTVDASDFTPTVFEGNIADHMAFLLRCTFRGDPPPPVAYACRRIRDISTSNLLNLQFNSGSGNFDEIYLINELDVCFDSFSNIVTWLVDKYCPIRSIRRASSNLYRWITPEIRRASVNLKYLHWVRLNMHTQEAANTYKRAKSDYSALLRQAKYSYNTNLIECSSNKNKTVWNLVKTITGRENLSSKKINLNVNDVTISEPQEVANAFGTYFSSVVVSTLDEYFGPVRSLSCTSKMVSNGTFFFYPVSEEEVISTITNLNNKSSTGLDHLSTRVVKAMSSAIARPLAHIVNLSVASGRFPTRLKIAAVTPIHKKNAIDDITNYRPISVLSVFSKIIERIVHNRIMNYLNKFDIICKNQHGFRVGRSTQTAAGEFVQCVYERLDEGLFVAGLFFDLARAFESLGLGFVRTKLYDLGFRGVFLDWIMCYLSGRSFYVRVEGSSSERFPVDIGVPQGSVLGPLIFSLFINDLPKYVGASFLVLFADDTSMVVTARSVEELTVNCGLIMRDFCSWCHSNNLMVNISKTECLFFKCSNRSNHPLTIKYDHETLTSKSVTKFLGVYVDGGLRWSDHVDNLSKKLSKSYFAINRVKNSLPLTSLFNVYYSLVYSNISYNIILWGNSTDAGRIFIAQKRIIRMMLGLGPLESCRPAFLKYRILPLPCIFILSCLIYVRDNISLMSKFSDHHSYGTRNDDMLCFPRHRTTKFENSPLYQGIKFFNHLPKNVKRLDSRGYKKTVKSMLLKKCFYSVAEFLNDKLS